MHAIKLQNSLIFQFRVERRELDIYKNIDNRCEHTIL